MRQFSTLKVHAGMNSIPLCYFVHWWYLSLKWYTKLEVRKDGLVRSIRIEMKKGVLVRSLSFYFKL